MVKQLLLKVHFIKKTTSININEIESNRIVVFNKTSYCNKCSLKHCIGYGHTDGNLSPLNIRLPQLTGYVKHFNDENKIINVLVVDKKLLKKYNEIWNKIKSLLKMEFDKNPMYQNKYITAKLNNTKFEHETMSVMIYP